MLENNLKTHTFTSLPAIVHTSFRVGWWEIKQFLCFLPHWESLLKMQKRITVLGMRKSNWIFAPGLSWNRQLFQRPQQLAIALASEGEQVFYLDVNWEIGNKPKLEEISPNFYLCKAHPIVFGGLASPYLYLLTWSYSPQIWLNKPQIIYDIVDDLSAFQIDQNVLRVQHAKRIRQAKLVIATSVYLEKIFRGECNNFLLCPNGVQFELFAKSHKKIDAEILKIRNMGKPVIGYFGALADWFDDALLTDLAKLRPDLNFVLIGPDLHKSKRNRSWAGMTNVFWLGERSYQDIPASVDGFDVVIIPFKLNAITHAASLIKLYEAFAAGKPVVLTPMEESLRFKEILPATTIAEWSQQIDLALKMKNDKAFVQRIQEIASVHTWQSRARQILSALK